MTRITITLDEYLGALAQVTGVVGAITQRTVANFRLQRSLAGQNGMLANPVVALMLIAFEDYLDEQRPILVALGRRLTLDNGEPRHVITNIDIAGEEVVIDFADEIDAVAWKLRWQ